MFTFQYRGYYVHGRIDRNEVTVQGPDYFGKAASRDAAIRLIRTLTKGAR